MPRGVNTRWQGSEGPETSCQRQINLLFFNSRHHMYTSSAVLHNGHHVTSAIPETLILRCPPRFGYIYGSRNSLLAKSRSYQAGIFKIKSQHRLQKKNPIYIIHPRVMKPVPSAPTSQILAIQSGVSQRPQATTHIRQSQFSAAGPVQRASRPSLAPLKKKQSRGVKSPNRPSVLT